VGDFLAGRSFPSSLSLLSVSLEREIYVSLPSRSIIQCRNDNCSQLCTMSGRQPNYPSAEASPGGNVAAAAGNE
jgi:hypothetical protein